MKTKLFTLFFALAASVGTMFADGTRIGDLYYNLNATDQTAEVTYESRYDDSNYTGLTTANIPASVTYSGTTYSVTSIGSRAFSDCISLTSVTIPNSVTSIGKYAFLNCSSLTSVTIPNSVTSIGSCAFYGCSGLTSATIPNSVTSIGSSAFQYCSSLTSVTIPNSVISIGTQAFFGCTGLTSATIGNSVTSIGEAAFYDCTSLTSVTIPNSVTSIGGAAFAGCSSLTTPVYNAHVFAFMPISYSGAYTIPDGIESIAGAAFYNCSSLTSMTIPNSVTSIGHNAFNDCSSLTTITNYATTPQTINSDVFAGVDLSACTLYVLNESIALYKDADVWKGFNSIEPIGAIQTTMEDDEVDIIPEDNSIDITWPAVENAYSYELVIKDKNGNVICTLIFNANGQLTSIAFAAPGRGQRAAQVAGFTFTVTSLNSGSEYSYSIAAKGSQGEVLDTKQGSFTTTGGTTTAMDNASLDASPVKVLRNGEVLILRGGKTYTIQGQEVR